jgi:hypothetical protein
MGERRSPIANPPLKPGTFSLGTLNMVFQIEGVF